MQSQGLEGKHTAEESLFSLNSCDFFPLPLCTLALISVRRPSRRNLCLNRAAKGRAIPLIHGLKPHGGPYPL